MSIQPKFAGYIAFKQTNNPTFNQELLLKSRKLMEANPPCRISGLGVGTFFTELYAHEKLEPAIIAFAQEKNVPYLLHQEMKERKLKPPSLDIYSRGEFPEQVLKVFENALKYNPETLIPGNPQYKQLHPEATEFEKMVIDRLA